MVNIAFDIVKAQVILGVCASLFAIWGLGDYYWALLLLCLWPIAVVPATHAAAFMFKSEWAAQFCAIAANFTILGLLPFVVSSLWFNLNTMHMADRLNNGFLVLPGYGLSRALLYGGYSKTLTRFRQSIGQENESQAVWADGNFGYNVSSVFI